jgi:hypothetical protein
MSEANVELARRGFEAVAHGDFHALREISTPRSNGTAARDRAVAGSVRGEAYA